MGRHSNDSFQIHGILNGVNMSAAVTFRCINGLRHDIGLQTIGPDSGHPFQEVRFTGEQRPTIATGVYALKSLFDLLSPFGTNCITSDGTRPGVRGFLQSHNPCAANARTSGSNHRRITQAAAQILISSFGGSRGQSAMAAVVSHALSTDGAADPEAIVQNAALPSTFIDDEEFVIRAPLVGNSQMSQDSVISWQVDLNVAMNVIVPAGSIFPTHVDITKIVPRWSITHDDPTFLDASKIPYSGKEVTLANTYAFLQKRTPFGGLVAAASTEHIKVAMAGMAYFTTHYDANGSATGTGEIVIESTEGAGGVPMTITTGVGIS